MAGRAARPHTARVARLLALSALAVAASSAVGPAAARSATSGDPSHPAAEVHGAIDADDVRCSGPIGDLPVPAALPAAAVPQLAPLRALGDAPSVPGASLAAPGLPLLALAPKTSPPPAPRRHR